MEDEKNEEMLEEERHKCVMCNEDLNPETYLALPYGIICEINQTKLFYHSWKQTFEIMKTRYINTLGVDKDVLSFDEELFKTYQFLTRENSGTFIRTCGHWIHFKCLNDFKAKHQQNRYIMMIGEDDDVYEF